MNIASEIENPHNNKSMNQKLNSSFVLLLSTLVIPGILAAQIITDPSDAFVDGTNVVEVGGDWQIRIGNTGGVTSAAVMAFQLPTLGVGESFDTANLKIVHYYSTQTDPNQTVNTNFNGDLFGLTRISATPTILGTDFSAPATLLQSAFIASTSPGSVDVNTDPAGDSALVAFLNTQYAGGANAGQYVFLRISPDATLTGVNDVDNRMEILARGAGDPSEWPVITYTAVPEPASALLLVGGLALGVLLCRRTLAHRL